MKNTLLLRATISALTLFPLATAAQDSGATPAADTAANRKPDLTGAVTVREIPDYRLMLSLPDAMRGQLAGVRIITTDGQPGESMRLQIRGAGSIYASTTPLYVIDGVQSQALDINIHDVKRIEVLKDGASTAIYGALGGNGVVIVTTKRGSKGAPRVDFTFNNSVQTVARPIAMMTPYEYMRAGYDSSLGFDPTSYVPPYNYPGSSTNYYTDLEGRVYYASASSQWNNYNDYRNPVVNTDWQRKMLRAAAVRDYHLGVSGGGERATYSVMGGYFDQDGIVRGSGYRRWSGRANFDLRVGKSSHLGFNLSGLNTIQRGSDYSSASGVLISMLATPPTIPYTNDQITYTDASGYEYSMISPGYVSDNDRRNNKKSNVSARVYLDADLGAGLGLDVAYNLTRNKTSSTVTDGRYDDCRYDHQLNAALKYNKNWPSGFNLDALVGSTATYSKENFRYDAGTVEFMGSTYRLGASGYGKDFTNAAPFSSIDLDYKRRYIFSAVARYDKTQGLSEKVWAWYPGFSAAWRITEEQWLKGERGISDLTLRASWGRSGNSTMPASWLESAVTSPHHPIWLSTRNEMSTQRNLGVDFGFFGNRLTGTVDYYDKVSDNLLLKGVRYYPGYYPYPATPDYDITYFNGGKLRNRGWELTLRAVLIDRHEFFWDVSGNISFNRQKVLDNGMSPDWNNNPDAYRANSTLPPSAVFVTGKPLGTWYGVPSNGLLRKQSDVGKAFPEASTQWKSGYIPGMYNYTDLNGDGYISLNGDGTILGNSQPDFTGGISSTVSWKNLTLNVGLEFVSGGKIFDATRYYLANSGGTNKMQSSADYFRPTLYDAFNGTGDTGNEGARWPSLGSLGRSGGSSGFITNADLESASYLRINDITLTYSLPGKAFRAIGILDVLRTQKCDIWVSVRNPWVFTSYSGYDPDFDSGDPLMPGLDWSSYPRARAFTLGVNLTF